MSEILNLKRSRIFDVDKRCLRQMGHTNKMEHVHGIVALTMLSWVIGVSSQTPQYDNILVSQNMPVSMSSTFNDNTFGEAELAVDGKLIRRDAAICTCCAVTNKGPGARFTLNLEHGYRISQINIYGASKGRKWGLSGVNLYLGNTDNRKHGVLVHTITHPQQENITVNGTEIYQYVIAEKVEETRLVICEIEVYTPVCKDGYYGDCTKQCGQCLDNDVCNKTSGVCTRGCNPGYNTDWCATECEDGTFGPNCTQRCGQCVHGAPCNNVHGSCDGGCSPGYEGHMCDKKCGNNTYGDSCAYSCGRCLHGSDCHHVDGTCPWCDDGFIGGGCNSTMGLKEEQTGPSSVVILGGAVGALAVLVICSVGIISFLMRRTIQLKNELHHHASERDTTTLENTPATNPYEALQRDQVQHTIPYLDYETLILDDVQYQNS